MPNILLPAGLSQTSGKGIELHLLRLKLGQVFYSPGGTFKYRVIGACCRLYDRENLPYPCCRLCWRGKEPFWNRIGKRFVPDIAVKRSPSYCVQLVNYPEAEPFVMTLYWMKLSPEQQQWWYAARSPVALIDEVIAQNSRQSKAVA